MWIFQFSCLLQN